MKYNKRKELSMEQPKYTKTQRIVALIGVILLALLYIATLISAIIATPATPQLFKMCLLASFIIPLVIWGYSKVVKFLTDR